MELEKLVAQINAGVQFAKNPEWIAELLKRKKLSAAARKVLRRCAGLSAEQLKLLVEILSEERVLVSLEGRTYAIGGRADGVAWLVQAMELDAPEYTVASDASACTCPDYKFRPLHECKHMRAVRRLL